MKRRMIVLCAVLVAMTALSTTAFAIDEAEVNAAINASGKEAVSGNLLIWFLCAVGFLKISQKIDSFMSGLGINVGNTGSSMLTEMLLAGRGVGAAASVFGGAVGGAVNNAASTAYNSSKAFTGGGNSVISIAKRAVGNTAAAGATQRGVGISGAIGGAMFASSLNNGGRLASNVIGAVATGNYSKVGSITGEKASQALTSYLGYADVAPITANPTVVATPDTTESDDAGEYIGNKNSKKFNLPTCKNLPAEKNRIYFDSRQAAIDAGQTPCGNCKP